VELETWCYQLNLNRNLGKTNPLNEKDLEDFIALQKTQVESENSWIIDISDINQDTFDLSVKNPNAPEQAPLRVPPGKSSTVCKLQVVNSAFLRALEALSVLLKRI
jgi:type I restriction enzyme M protein